MPRLLALLAAVLLAAHPVLGAAQTPTPVPPTPPAQPPTGPGGAAVAYAKVVAVAHDQRPVRYWLFAPADPVAGTPPPASPLPLVIFLHATGLTDPSTYRAWLDHLAQRGALVLFADWQVGTGDTSVLLAEVRAALGELGTGALPAFDPARVVVVGHSFGGALAADYAALAAGAGLPVPTLVMAIAPGCGRGACLVPGLRAIPATTWLLVVTEADDGTVTDEVAREVWAAMAAIPAAHRAYLTVRTDLRGAPQLWADHTQALADEPDALDWYGTWKWLDAGMACAFAGKDCEYAFGGTPQQRFMGIWSDGVPVAEAVVTTDPAPPATPAP